MPEADRLKPSTPTTAANALSGSPQSLLRKRRSHLSDDDDRRDSGLASTMSAAEPAPASLPPPDSSTTAPVPPGSAHSAVPAIRMNDGSSPRASALLEGQQQSKMQRPRTSDKDQRDSSTRDSFHGITTDIPSGKLEDPFTSDDLSFSKRGSVILGGKKAMAAVSRFGPGKGSKSSFLTGESAAVGGSPAQDQRFVSLDDRLLSQRVRSMYEQGAEIPPTATSQALPMQGEALPEAESPSLDVVTELPQILSPKVGYEAGELANGTTSRRASYIKREPWEAAGGIEDWRDVEGADVDRYGFIKPRRTNSASSTRNLTRSSSPNPSSPDASQQQAAATSSPEKETSHSPRKLRRPPPDAKRGNRLSVGNAQSQLRPDSSRANRSVTTPSLMTNRSRRSLTPSFLSFGGSSTTNKGRRWADEAPEMLTPAPGLPDANPSRTNDTSDSSKSALEESRAKKWAKMARTVQSGPANKGAGHTYSFDTSDRKLVDRTWKGIPDRWRAIAWHSFLTSSAKRHRGRSFTPDDVYITAYHAHQKVDCADDMQIDMDVPRTIGGHIMFRTRYRGGQRLMFRVLRALALQYPDPGYVQGMAPLAATLLCYYDEERAFVVACRMWEERGLSTLFGHGFTGLTAALEDFEARWLARTPRVRDVLVKELGVATSSYGIKWYLTLFSYSIPFAAQLRVWDVFMLLGGGDGGVDGEATVRGSARHRDSRHAYDALHAVAAALVDGMGEALVGADFENAMRLLTGQIPVGREDVLMRVARREWKENRRRL